MRPPNWRGYLSFDIIRHNSIQTALLLYAASLFNTQTPNTTNCAHCKYLPLCLRLPPSLLLPRFAQTVLQCQKIKLHRKVGRPRVPRILFLPGLFIFHHSYEAFDIKAVRLMALLVLWAQRSSASEPEKNFIYLTISVPDVSKSSMKLDLNPTGLSFTGTSDTKKTTYHVVLELFAEIDVENSKINHTARDIEMVLRKKELKEEYWPRLLKDKAKVHFVKTDFDKVG